MYKTTFIISKKQEKVFTRDLNREGFTGYFVEKSGKNYYLNIFTESKLLPVVLEHVPPASIEEVDEQSWGHSWADGFNGHELTCDIYVSAAGMPQPAKEYRHIITIDPRGSFGDGHHPTTRLCAGLLQEYISQHADAGNFAMIDAGTGSGLLAITAYILGVRKIDLFDIDENSVLMAEKNLRLNNITGIKPDHGDIYSYNFSVNYDIITANLLTVLFEDNISRLVGALASDGVLIVSGISTKWSSLFKKLASKNNLFIVKHKRLEGWNGYLLKKRRIDY